MTTGTISGARLDPLPAPFLDATAFLGDRRGQRHGKVRTSVALQGGRRLFVATDRLSAFDRVIGGVALKGQVLNQLAAWWFGSTRDIVANHLLSVPDPNATVGVEAVPLPVEVVVRGHITGVTSTSLWTRYAAGARVIDGVKLGDGMRKNQALPAPVVTPTTKGTDGAHDEPLSCNEVVDRGLVAAGLWLEVVSSALALFERGREVAGRAGLILADTKYEFGLGPDGRLLLIDELHTPDSSRLWVADSYDARVAAGEEPESLDKEPVRRALAETGFRGEGDPPALAPEVWAATACRYITAFERITGNPFQPGEYPVGPRLARNLAEAGW